MVCCIPLCCECTTSAVDSSAPSNSPEAPKNILCPRCNIVCNTSYKTDKKRCILCFCCSCPCGTAGPYLACESCGLNLGSSRIYRCKNCQVGAIAGSKFCSNCGTENK